MKTGLRIGGALVAAMVWLGAAHAQDARQDVRQDVRQDAREVFDGYIKDYLASHPEQVGFLAKEYFKAHPEAFAEILSEVLKHRPKTAAAAAAPSAPAPDRSAAIASNADALFSSSHQVTLGNSKGDVTLVEFFDYSCGFCKRALPDMMGLIKDDPNLKIVLKELPILGPGSADAARVAIAVRMQDTDGQAYLAFHRELLGAPGPASKEKALAAAKNQGLDMAKLDADIASEEVSATLNEDMKLASAMGVNGTPAYVVGNNVIAGAVGSGALKERIEAARRKTVN